LTITPPALAAPLTQLKSDGREVEIKFLLTEAIFKDAQKWERLGATAKRPRARRQHSVYFDSPDGDLRRHGAVLRVRSVRRRHILTFKWSGKFAGGSFERGEIEAPSPTPEPDLACLGDEIAGLIDAICQGQVLQQVYETDVKRVTYLVHHGVSDIEVAFDKGRILAGDRTLPICEMELELKSGHPADLYQLGVALTEAFPVAIGCQSKSARAALLLSGAPPAAVQAPRINANAPNVDEAIGLCLNNCISHFLSNWPAFQTGDRVRAVHQMRVAMRRMRSILGVFQRSFPCAEFVQFRQQAKLIAAALADARDWDVFIDLVAKGPLAAFPNDIGLPLLLIDAEKHRDTGYKTASATLAAAATSGFILSLQAFIAKHGWRNGPSGDSLPSLTAPSDIFFAQHLMRLHRKIMKSGKNFDRMTPYHRHELRKAFKKLRYLIDFFSDLFDLRASNKSYIGVVSMLQDQLGIFNDMTTAEEMVARLHTGGDQTALRATGIVIGWCGRGAAVDDSSLRKAWKKFRKLKSISYFKGHLE
jgi:inorganic triphosphatase YgiF